MSPKIAFFGNIIIIIIFVVAFTTIQKCLKYVIPLGENNKQISQIFTKINPIKVKVVFLKGTKNYGL